MFQMAADGASPGQIAKALNAEGIATPAVYRCLARPYLNLDQYSKRREWTTAMICKKLRNEVYLGRTLQGKSSKISFKSKTVRSNPREEWIIVEGTHEPLISEELYRSVRNRSVSRRSPPSRGFENVFAGIARCADCGRNMTPSRSRKKGAVYNLCCGGYKTYGAKECGNHFIDYHVLSQTVLAELRGWLALSDNQKSAILKVVEEKERAHRVSDFPAIAEDLKKLEQRSLEITVLMKKLYEDFIFGRVQPGMYEKLSAEYTAESTSIEATMVELQKHLQPAADKSDSYRAFFALLDQVTEIKELSKPLLRKLIDHIEVEQGHYQRDERGKRYKQQKIRIYYRFIGCMEEAQENT